MILADKIRESLEESGLTRKEFAEKAEIGLSTLNGILNGKIPNPTYFTVMKIAQIGNISLDEIGGLTSKNMGAEEVERVKKEYEKNEERVKKTLSEYSSIIAHQEETDEHNKEIIRRQDLRIQNLENTIKTMESNDNEIIRRQDLRIKSLEDRVAYQKNAIHRHIIAIVLLSVVIMLLIGLLVSIFVASPTKNIFT